MCYGGNPHSPPSLCLIVIPGGYGGVPQDDLIQQLTTCSANHQSDLIQELPTGSANHQSDLIQELPTGSFRLYAVK